MASKSWLHTVLPCLSPRKPEGASPSSKGAPDSARQRRLHENIMEETDSDAADALPERRPTFEEGLELARTLSRPVTSSSLKARSSGKLGTATTVASDDSSARSPQLPSRLRSSTSASPRMAGTKKDQSGKARISHKVTISAPSNFRRLDSDGTKLSPLTYPSPSRIRPLNLTMDASDPGLDEEELRSAQLMPTPRSRESFPLKSGALSPADEAWKLEPLPPLPSPDTTKEVQLPRIPESERDSTAESTSAATPAPAASVAAPADAPAKRKPMPIRTRANSDPTSPTVIPAGFAAEMLGSVPSPVELEAPNNGLPSATASSIDSRLRKTSTRASTSSLPSPTLARFSSRLSAGALNMLAFFPTTPQLTMRSSQSTPRLSPPPFPDYDVESPMPLFASPKLVSPVPPSPQMKAASSLGIWGVPSSDPAPFVHKSLPPTPKSVPAERGFMSIAAGIKAADVPLPIFSPASIASNKNIDAESIRIFLSPSTSAFPA